MFEAGCVVEFQRISDDSSVVVNLLLEKKADSQHGGKIILGFKRMQPPAPGRTIYSIGLSREHHEAIQQEGPHFGASSLESYELKSVLACIAEQFDDHLDARSLTQTAVGSSVGGPGALSLPPLPPPRPAQPPLVKVDLGSDTAPAPPRPSAPSSSSSASASASTSAASSSSSSSSSSPPSDPKTNPTPELPPSDFLGLGSLSQGLWSIVELPKHLPLACCSGPAPAAARRRKLSTEEDEGEGEGEEEEEGLGESAGQSREPGERREGDALHAHDSDSSSSSRGSEFYDAESVDWATITFHPDNEAGPPSPAHAHTHEQAHAGLNRVSRFDLNVVYASLCPDKARGPTSTAGRHLSCYPSGRVFMIDFSNPAHASGGAGAAAAAAAGAGGGSSASTSQALTLTDSLGSLPSLACLRLHRLGLHGPVPWPAWCPRLGSRLEALDLSHNALTGELDEGSIAMLTRLEVLNLSHNQLCGHLPITLGLLVRLESLMLNDNRFTGDVPAQIKGCLRLGYADLSGNAGLAAGKRERVVALLPKGCEVYL